MLPGLHDIVGADGVVYHWIDPAHRGEEAHAHPHDLHAWLGDAELMATYLRLMHQHPLLRYYAVNRPSADEAKPVALSDLTTRHGWRRYPLYREFFRPLRIEDQLAVLLDDGSDWLVGLTVARSRRGFTLSERDRLQQLGRALRPVHRQVSARRTARLAGAALAGYEIGPTRAIIMVDRHQRVTLAAGGLLDLLTGRAGAIVTGGRLPPPLQRVLDHIPPAAGAGTTNLSCACPSLRVTVHRHPGVDRAADTTIVVDQPATAANGDRLSPQQVTILEWTALGKPNKQIARIMGLSEHTVRTQLARAYRKLGVHCRTEAVAALRQPPWPVGHRMPPA